MLNSKVSAVFASIRALQAPIIVASLAAIIFALPGQTIELYGSIAQDVLFIGGFSRALGDNAGRAALLAIALGTLSTITLGVILWLAARALGAMPGAGGQTRTATYEGSARVLACVLGGIPLAAVACGLLRGSSHTVSNVFAVGLRDIMRDLGQDQKIADEWVGKIEAVPAALANVGYLYLGAAVMMAQRSWGCGISSSANVRETGQTYYAPFGGKALSLLGPSLQ